MNEDEHLAGLFGGGELALLYPSVHGGAMGRAIEQAEGGTDGGELAHPADLWTVYQGKLAVAGSGSGHVSG